MEADAAITEHRAHLQLVSCGMLPAQHASVLPDHGTVIKAFDSGRCWIVCARGMALKNLLWPKPDTRGLYGAAERSRMYHDRTHSSGMAHIIYIYIYKLVPAVARQWSVQWLEDVIKADPCF